jgi:ABC-type glycerol-3-phosphate transport system permease component
MLGQIERVTTFQKIIYYILMTVLALIVIYPFIFMLTTSLKDSPLVNNCGLRIT